MPTNTKQFLGSEDPEMKTCTTYARAYLKECIQKDIDPDHLELARKILVKWPKKHRPLDADEAEGIAIDAIEGWGMYGLFQQYEIEHIMEFFDEIKDTQETPDDVMEIGYRLNLVFIGATIVEENPEDIVDKVLQFIREYYSTVNPEIQCAIAFMAFGCSKYRARNYLPRLFFLSNLQELEEIYRGMEALLQIDRGSLATYH